MNFHPKRCYFFTILSFLFLTVASDSPSLSSNNITIIGTMGGFVYGIDSHSLEKKWTVNTGGPLLSAEQLTKSLSYALFPSPDGTLVYTGADGIKASATTAKALTAASPFLANGVLYRGEKIDKIVQIDLKTGNVLNDFGNSNSEYHAPPLTGNESILLLGRTDFHIRAYNATSGLEQFNLSYGEVTPLDFKYQKRAIKDDVGYIRSTSTSKTDSPKLGMGRKVPNTDVSISYECGTYSSDDKDTDSIMFSISNGIHSVPLYLDSPPAYSVGTVNDVLPDSNKPLVTSTQKQFLLPSSSSLELSRGNVLSPLQDKELRRELDSAMGVVPQKEDRGRALVTLPSMHLTRIKEVKNKKGGSSKHLKNDARRVEKLSHNIKSREEFGETQCEIPLQLFEFLDFDAFLGDHTLSALNHDHVVDQNSFSKLLTEYRFSKKELSLLTSIFVVLLIGFWRVFSLALGVGPGRMSGRISGDAEVTSSTSLKIFHDKELGRGSNGTVVLEGVLEGKRAVAVKKMLSRFQKTVDREISLLSLSDGHPNVVRYFQSIREGDFHLLVLELCDMSLWRFIEGNTAQRRRGEEERDRGPLKHICDDTKAALAQIVLGISHLHSKNIVHRDVKPHNILLASKCNTTHSAEDHNIDRAAGKTRIGDYFYKISDMGLSKQLSDSGEQSCSSFSYSSHCSSSSHDKGTIGWQPRELIQKRHIQQFSCMQKHKEDGSDSPMSQPQPHQELGDLLFKIDIFGLGCVFYYVLCDGMHPFGSVHDRERNILDGKCDVSLLSNHPDALDLISRMIDVDPSRRPTALQILAHPFFWSASLRLDFLNHLSERVQNQTRGQELQFHLEANRSQAVGKGPWSATLPSVLMQDLKAHGNYDFTTLSDCLRMMRNKRRHAEELSHEMKQLITPDVKFESFFLLDRWPGLLMYCVPIVCRYTLSEDPTFQKYGCRELRKIFVEMSTAEVQCKPPSPDCVLEGIVESTGPNISVGTQNVATVTIASVADVAWKGSELQKQGGCRGWWLPSSTVLLEEGSSSLSVPLDAKRSHPRHTKCLRNNPHYRSHICEFKEKCERKHHKKEIKRCTFAHDPVELKQRKKQFF